MVQTIDCSFVFCNPSHKLVMLCFKDNNSKRALSFGY